MRTPIAMNPGPWSRAVFPDSAWDGQTACDAFAEGRRQQCIQAAWAHALGRTLHGWRAPVWVPRVGDRVMTVDGTFERVEHGEIVTHRHADVAGRDVRVLFDGYRTSTPMHSHELEPIR